MPSLRHAPGWARAVAAAVVAGLVAVPLGGWDTVERDASQVQVLEPGQRHDSDRFATSLERAEVLAVPPGSSLDPEPGVAYLVLHGRLENRTGASQTPPSDLLVVEAGGRTLEDPPRVELASDGTTSPDLQPGLPADVVFVWEIEEGEVAAGDEVEVSVVDRTEIESYVSSGTTWISPRVGAVVDLVVA